MSEPLLNLDALRVYERLKSRAKSVLVAFNEQRFEQGESALAEIRDNLATARTTGTAIDEVYLNELFVLDRYADLLLKYGEIWQKIIKGQFADSWSSLQDALDLLRVIKKFSGIDVSFFEDQLTELEATYPYSIFVSVGMFVEGFDCSICGLDIDSDACPHRRGHLYRGVMASGIARNDLRPDHLAFTTTPADKRCVIQYDEGGEHFQLVRLLSNLVKSNECRPSDFSHLRHSIRPLPNGAPRNLGRNDPCFCGSGKKFKKCFPSHPPTEQKHVDIIAVPRSIEDAVR